MRRAVRIALLVVGSLIYAGAVVLGVLRIIGVEDLQDAFGWLIGRGCGGGPCPVSQFIGLIVIVTVVGMTIPGLIGLGILWVKRRDRSDREVADIDTYFRSEPTMGEPLPEVGEERKFYRDRQGRLRPLTFHEPHPDTGEGSITKP